MILPKKLSPSRVKCTYSIHNLYQINKSFFCYEKLRWAIYDLRFTIYDLRFNDLRFTIYDLRFNDLRFNDVAMKRFTIWDSEASSEWR
jgi:hypothetical protein